MGAKEARITIGDAGEEVVEAFVQYLYMKSIPESLSYVDLFPLAHRYECEGLLRLCADDMLEMLSEQNCVKFVAMLQPFEDDPALGAYWTQLADRITSDPILVKALMRGV